VQADLFFVWSEARGEGSDAWFWRAFYYPMGPTLMALHELHARRLATIVNLFEDALNRIEIVLQSSEESPGEPVAHSARLTRSQVAGMRKRIRTLRRTLHRATEGFSIRRQRPEPRQILSAELSALWVILENARPERMKGYGIDFAPTERADWEKMIEELAREVEGLRRLAMNTSAIKDARQR
jgi:hypothetical protein